MKRLLAFSVALLFSPACAAQQAFPRFAHAGVIEGFYGTPWSQRDRLDILRFLGRAGLNTYVYAPKDDPYHRGRWREPYPRAEAERLQQLVDSARAAGVSLWYAVSPGGTITYSDSGDYQALLAKLSAVRALGVTTFGLFLDDVPTTLSHERDRRSYGSLAAAHASLINRLGRSLRDWGDTLVVTPTTYTEAWGDPDYLAALGRDADPTVPFFWTGPDVASPTITSADAARWRALAGRPLLLWDNYPVNDYARWRPFLGPLSGRAPDLASSVTGILSNPMNQAHASMIALATLGIYAGDPAGYDPDAAWRASLHTLYGDSAAQLLAPFLHAYGDYGWEANVFEPLYLLGDTVPAGAIAARLEELDRTITALKQARSTGSEPLDPLVGDLAPFVAGTRQRLAALQSDTAYRAEGDVLVYRQALDVYPAPRGPKVSVDGRLDEWRGVAWHPLRGPGRADSPARVALRWAGDLLYLAIRVRDPVLRLAAGDRVGEGDHVLLVVDTDSTGGPRGLTPQDLVVAVGAPDRRGSTRAFVGAMDFQGFQRKWSADNDGLTLSAFVLTTFGKSHPDAARVQRAAARVAGGYTMELAVPRSQGDALRMSLSVKGAGRAGGIVSLERRHYPANPATFARVLFR